MIAVTTIQAGICCIDQKKKKDAMIQFISYLYDKICPDCCVDINRFIYLIIYYRKTGILRVAYDNTWRVK